MPEMLPASHSILCTASLSSYAERHYAIGKVSGCDFLNLGLNDTYLIKASAGKFILRVYHLNWRSWPDIAYELDALAHLSDKGIPVSRALKRTDGKLFDAILTPEGERFLALFTYAEGNPPDYAENETLEAYLYGKAVAQIHVHTESFCSEHPRFELFQESLINQPLKEIDPLLTHRPEDWQYLLEFSRKLSATIQAMEQKVPLEQGFCHGDFHGWNAHFNAQQQITFFDFDCCGKGWRAYDLATFFWGARLRDKHKARCPHFLRGYTEVRPFPEGSLASIPCFVAVRQLWLMGVLASKSNRLGRMDDKYMDRQLKFCREMEVECFQQTVHETYLQ